MRILIHGSYFYIQENRRVVNLTQEQHVGAAFKCMAVHVTGAMILHAYKFISCKVSVQLV